MVRFRLIPSAVLLAATALAQGPETRSPTKEQDPKPTIRGVTISTHGSGWDWGTDVIEPAMVSIKKVGGTWACTHPYAGIARDGTVSFRTRRRGGRGRRGRRGRGRQREAQPQVQNQDTQVPAHWTRPIEAAHKAGMKILIKPHLSYWGRFSWRGAIEFKTEEEWDRFFTTYEKWIVAVAKACKNADGFVVGTELDKTIQYTGRWKKIIKAVREVTDAPLTYAANWTDYEKVKFWDDLDVIGIQAYFPLTKNKNADEKEIAAGWKKVMGRLRRFADRHGKEIVFTELGYNCSHKAAIEPWKYQSDGSDALPVQEACLRSALAAIEAEPKVIGSFLWKWFPPPYENGRNFRLATPRMKKVISRIWASGSKDTKPRPRIPH